MLSAITLPNIVGRGWIIRRPDGTHYARIFVKQDFTMPEGHVRVHEEKRTMERLPTDRDLLKERLKTAATDLGVPGTLEFIERPIS